MTNQQPSGSPDGKELYFASNRSGSNETWKVLIAGGEPARVTQGGRGGVISLGGEYSVYSKAGVPGLFRMAARGARSSRWRPTERVGGTRPRTVYYLAGRTLRFFDLATGKVRTVADLPKAATANLCASPDGRYVVYPQVDQGKTDLMLVEGFR